MTGSGMGFMRAPALAHRQLVPAWQVAAVICVNLVAFYDFLIYAVMAPQLALALFPQHDPMTALMATFAAFAAGFAMRPVGALVMGRIADRHGRVAALRVNVALMAMAMAGFTLLPDHAAIGAVSGGIAVVLRLVQGFVIGGEPGPSTAWLVEAAPLSHRGFYASFQYASQDAAILLAGAVSMGLSVLFDAAQLALWGWRFAFGIGAVLLAVAWPLRRRLSETALLAGAAMPAGTARPGLRFYVASGVLLAQSTVGIYVLIELSTHAVAVLGHDGMGGSAITLAVGLGGLVGGPLGGWLADRAGRRRIGATFLCMLCALSLLGFPYVVGKGNVTLLVGWAGLAAFCAALANAALFVAIAEALPVQRRSLVLGTLYAAVVAAFGGTTPLVLTWLSGSAAGGIEERGGIAPGLVLAVVSAMGVLAALALPRTPKSRH